MTGGEDGFINALSTHPHTPAEAWTTLMEGNRRFVESSASHPNQDAARRTSLMSTQHPFVMIFGCSDSRLAAEIIFDLGLGDAFVVRTAGHVIDNTALGSLEYGVEYLDVPLIVVLGHDSCGAVTATKGAVGRRPPKDRRGGPDLPPRRGTRGPRLQQRPHRQLDRSPPINSGSVPVRPSRHGPFTLGALLRATSVPNRAHGTVPRPVRYESDAEQSTGGSTADHGFRRRTSPQPPGFLGARAAAIGWKHD